MKSETGSREKCCAHVFLCFVSGMGRVQTTGVNWPIWVKVLL